MNATPGGKDESRVPALLRRGQEADVGDRVLLLMSTVTITVFNFISQVMMYICWCISSALYAAFLCR